MQKFLNKVLANQINIHVRKKTHHGHVGFIPEMQVCFNQVIGGCISMKTIFFSKDAEKALDKIK